MTTLFPASLSEADYCALENALLATEKGRRFLRAYINRNRGTETLRLLRSISRMHRAALGAPGVNAEVCRDLTGILRIVANRREKAACRADGAGKAASLMDGLEEIEACVIALIEFDRGENGRPAAGSGARRVIRTGARQLFAGA